MVWPMCEMRLVPIEHCCRWCFAQPTLHSGTRRRATAASTLVARLQNTWRMDCADIFARYVSTGDEDDNEDDDGEEEEEEGDVEEEEEEGDEEEAAEGADAPVNGELKPPQHSYPSPKSPPSRGSSKMHLQGCHKTAQLHDALPLPPIPPT